MPWIDACAADDIEEEDVLRWDHAGRSFAIYHGAEIGRVCAGKMR
jgi:3-phenylpropionate/trans-cinnamate dioxygenase ferredoxin subunit